VDTETRDWQTLCEAASKEYDPEQLLALVSELVEVLEQGRPHPANLPRAEENYPVGARIRLRH
jgi:hypothetical protein